MPNTRWITLISLLVPLWLGAQQPDLSAVDARLSGLVARAALPGAVLIAQRIGEPPIVRTYGGYTAEQRVPIGSASKAAAGALFGLLVAQGKMRWDDTVDRYLPTAPLDKRRITLRQLMSHTSGLPGTDSACLNQASLRLADCATEILALPLTSTPGSAFHYGGNSMQVAGRMAEVATGLTFDELFRTTLADPLGMAQTDFGFTSTMAGRISVSNPRVAGGLRTSANEYAKLLQWLLARGVGAGAPLLPGPVLDDLMRDQTRDAAVVFRPPTLAQALGYGIGLWQERLDSTGAAAMLSSPGAFGTFPVIDREHGYAGLFLTVKTLAAVDADVRAMWNELSLAYANAGADRRPALTVLDGAGSRRDSANAALTVMASGPANQIAQGFIGDGPSLRDPRGWLGTAQLGTYGTSLIAQRVVPTSTTAIALTANGARALLWPRAAARGLILRFHGSGGSADYAARGHDAAALTVGALAQGFAVAALDSSDRINRQWSGGNTLSNPDIVNVRALLDLLRSRGDISAQTPIFCEGVSNGGGFCSRAAALLGFRALALVIATGIDPALVPTPAPTIWSLAERDSILAAGFATTANTYAETLRARGIAAEVTVQAPFAVPATYFTRIPGVDGDLAAAIHLSLRNAGVLDAMHQVVTLNASPVVPAGAAPHVAAIADLLAAAAAEHQYVASTTHRVLHFFSSALDPALTGLWYQPAEPGWGLSIAQQGDQLFPVMYSYASDGRPTWWVGSGVVRGNDGRFSGPAYRATGNPFSAIAGDTGAQLSEVGQFWIAPGAAGSLQFELLINGVRQTKVLQPLRFGRLPLCQLRSGSRAISANRTDIYYHPLEPGYGLMLTEQDQTIVATWYTYGADRAPLWALATLSRDAQGVYQGDLVRPTAGTPFTAINGAAATSFPVPTVGRASLRFVDGERVRFNYTMDGSTGEKDLERFVFDLRPSDCQ